MIELINEASLKDIQAKYYSNIDMGIIQKLNELSPDYNPSQPDRKTNYLPWLLDRFIKKDGIILSCLNDSASFDKMKYTLGRFEQIKNELPVERRDIRKFSGEGIHNLILVVYKDYKTQKEIRDSINKETEFLYEDENWKIVSPKTYESSKYWGKNTKWCTTYQNSDSYFQRYSKEGKLYINIDKRDNKKWQFHFESNSFFDEEDNDLMDSETLVDNDIASEGDSVSVFELTEMTEEVYNWYLKERGDSAKVLKEEFDVEGDYESRMWPGDDCRWVFDVGNEAVYFVKRGENYCLEQGTIGESYLDDDVSVKDLTDNEYDLQHILEDSNNLLVVENTDGYLDFVHYMDDMGPLAWRNVPREDCHYVYNSYIFEYGSDWVVCLEDDYYPNEIENGYSYEILDSYEIIAIEDSNGTFSFYNFHDSEPYLGDVRKAEDGEFNIDDEGYIHSIDQEGNKVKCDLNNLDYSSEWELEDDETEDEDNEPQMDEEKSKFWTTLNKLNEIHKRDSNEKII